MPLDEEPQTTPAPSSSWAEPPTTTAAPRIPAPPYASSNGGGYTVAPTPPPSNPMFRRLAFIVLPLALVIGGFFFGWHYFHSTPKLEEMVPKDTIGVVVTDAHWWWDASADVRAVPAVRDEIQKAEKESGFSLENDIAPWVGQTGLTVLNADAKKMQAAAYFQVRDWPAFYRFYQKVRQKSTEGPDGAQWTESTYRGVKIQTIGSKSSSDLITADPKLTVAWIKGWVLVGVGEGAMETVIDTYQGRVPSILQDPTWAAALKSRPEKWVVWGGISGKTFFKAIQPYADGAMPSFSPSDTFGDSAPNKSVLTNPSKMMGSPDQYDFVTIQSMTDTGNGLRFDTNAVAGSDRVKNLWHDLKGTSGSVTGNILAQLPKDSHIAILAHDPAGWWTRYKKAIVAQLPADTQKEVKDFEEKAAPIEAMLTDYPGDCAFALTGGSDKGFGAVLLAQGKSPDAVRSSTQDLVAYLKKNDVKVEPKGADDYVLPEAVDKSQPAFPLALEFGVRKDYLAAATSPQWLDASVTGGGSSLNLPAEARGADFVAMGNFTMLPDIFREMDRKSSDTPVPADAKKAMQDTGLESANWCGYLKIAPDGASQQATWEISQWNWRAAMKQEIADLQKLQ